MPFLVAILYITALLCDVLFVSIKVDILKYLYWAFSFSGSIAAICYVIAIVKKQQAAREKENADEDK